MSKKLKKEIMALNKIPETFRVGETVTFWEGAIRSRVQVTEVEGDEVTIVDRLGQELKFKARLTDGTHVALGTDDFEEEPDMIDHAPPNLTKSPRYKSSSSPSSTKVSSSRKDSSSRRGFSFPSFSDFEPAYESLEFIFELLSGIGDVLSGLGDLLSIFSDIFGGF